MPVVLSQHYLRADSRYLDVERVLYHYPQVYFKRIRAYDRFVYYRPLGRTAARADSKTYFGHGVLGTPFPDPADASLKFVDVVQYQSFPRLVALTDADGLYFETEGTTPIQGQAAVREISELTYLRVLAAAGVTNTSISMMPDTRLVGTMDTPNTSSWPVDAFRLIDTIPPGTGYVPQGNELPNVYEAAALQERARADHQRVLASIARLAHRRGGQTLYNNNVDLVVRFGQTRILVEAKSLNDPRSAVDRMRYGMGQLLDYGVRYRADLVGARPMLAFGRAPNADTGWIAKILNENGVAFACLDGEGVKPFNELARESGLFS